MLIRRKSEVMLFYADCQGVLELLERFQTLNVTSQFDRSVTSLLRKFID